MPLHLCLQAATLCAAGCNPMCCTARYVRACQVALLLYEAGADPYAAAQGGESAIDALRRIGGRSSMDLHAELTSRVAARGAAQAGPEAAVAAAGRGEEDDEEGEEERDAAKALAASAPREVLLPSVHPYPLEPCVKGNYCDVRGPGCNYSPTVYSSVECDWDICQVTLTLICLRQACYTMLHVLLLL